jgi:hypothetical protein
MRKTLCSIALMGVLSLAGCKRTERAIDGRVYDKVHMPQTTKIIVTPVDMGDNSYSYEVKDIPERFVLRVEEKVGGKEYQTSVDVSEDTFREYEVGDRYPRQEK